MEAGAHWKSRPRSEMYVLCNIFFRVDVHFFAAGYGMMKAHQSSNWKNLKRLASRKSKNDLVDASGAHLKVGDASRSGCRAAAKAIILRTRCDKKMPLWILRCKKCHLGFALLGLYPWPLPGRRFWGHLQL